MENSHRRMILELEEKHRREIQTLKIEKETELAEETRATLSGSYFQLALNVNVKYYTT